MSLIRIYVITFITLSYFGFTQVRFKYGPELGYGFAQKVEDPHRVTGNSRNDVITEDRSNYSSAVPGLAGDLLIGKHLRFGFGVQYQKFGSHYSEHRDGHDLLNHKTFRTNETIDQSFSSLCFPLTIGVTARIWKLSPTFFIGARPNYMLSGSYASTYSYDHDIDSLDSYSTYNFNPLSAQFGSFHITNLIRQRIRAGVSLFIGEWVKVSYYRFVGGTISYAIGGPLSCFGYSCYNTDHVVSITLFIPQKKRSNLECKLVHKKHKEVPVD
jgi:hypothetical protein